MIRAVGTALFLVVAAAAQSRLEPPVWGFGTPDAGEVLEKVLTVHAESGRIARVVSGCGCLSVTIEDGDLSDGEGKVRLRLVTAGESGPLSKTATVVLADGTRLKASVVGEIRPRWWISRKSLQLGRLRPGRAATTSFSFGSRDDVDLGALRVVPSDPAVTTTLEEIEPRHWRVRVAVAPEGGAGRFRAEIEVLTDDSLVPRRVVEVFAERVPPVVASPGKVPFGRLKPGEARRREVVVEATDGKPFKVLRASSADPRIAIAVETLAKGKRYRLRVTCTPRAGDRRVGGDIVVLTDHPAAERVIVPWFGVVFGSRSGQESSSQIRR